jgi:hypothetical protein
MARFTDPAWYLPRNDEGGDERALKGYEAREVRY